MIVRMLQAWDLKFSLAVHVHHTTFPVVNEKQQNKRALKHHDGTHKLLCNYELWYHFTDLKWLTISVLPGTVPDLVSNACGWLGCESIYQNGGGQRHGHM